MSTSVFVRIAAVLTVLGLLLAFAGPASAMKPQKTVVHEEFDEVKCGINRHTTIDGWINQHIQNVVIEETTPGANSFWIGVIQLHLDLTWTNAAGVTMTDQFRNTIQEGDLVDLGDGFWEYTWTANGIIDKIRIGNKILLIERGSLSAREVFYFGDLSTVDDDYYVSGEITDINGPHPLSETEDDLFCEIFTHYMG